MKFLVDEMPDCSQECPFCKLYWEGGAYIPYCVINGNEGHIVDCKYFDTNNPDDCRLLKVQEVNDEN